jgi:hypothetical protein
VNLDENRNDVPLYDSTVNVENLHWMEDFLGGMQEFGGLRSPKWDDTDLPSRDKARVERGAKLYQTYCQDCHLPPLDELRDDVRRKDPAHKELWAIDPQSKKRFLRLVECDLREIGTDPNQALNFYRRVAFFRGNSISAARGLYAVTEFIRRDKYRQLRPSANVQEYDRFREYHRDATRADVEAGTFMDEALKPNLKYKARPLNGIWATPPYLHNGSVPNLYEMLVPVACRSPSFYLGTTLFDPKKVGYRPEKFEGAFLLDTSLEGIHNGGHEFRNLTLAEFESVSDAAASKREGPETTRKRWSRVLNVPEVELPKANNRAFWKKVRERTHATLKTERIKRDHPFKGVIGPELSHEERMELIEYLKSL